ncbi:MAG: hypothetical protein HYX56_05790 [Chloroflexi bacterium]|nr:hypothetical protein [Chloroflexota bacterium]
MNDGTGFSMGMVTALVVVLLVLVLVLGVAPVGNEQRPIIDIGLGRGR